MQNLKINLFLIFILATTSGWALDNDRLAKIIIEGPGCISNFKTNQTECPKGLTISQGSMLIKASYGRIFHENKAVQKVLMHGKQVEMKQDMEDGSVMMIKADEFDYRKQNEKVFLKGSVSIDSSIGVTTGEEIEFDLKTQQIKSLGDDNTQQFRMEIDQEND